ncbi:hypothetical protein [Sphingomonas sp. SRS2]|uniref:hypothetical protein n=1 Tax=Sphingomonas sp. SRS2 TaxID=133190 RepID=UPI000B1D739E|nr:hypothetical protein [Sphingomonas sp. SRS2]
MHKLTTIIALLATACTAQPAAAESLIEKIGPNRFAAHTAAALLDTGTTYSCSRRRTCEEGNPALRGLFGKRLSLTDAVGAFLLMEGVYIGGSVLIGEAAGYDSTARDIFQISLIGTHGIAAGLNLRF